MSHVPDLHRPSHGNFTRDSFRQPKHIRDANRRQLLATYSEESDCADTFTRPPSQFTLRSSIAEPLSSSARLSSKGRLSMISLSHIESGIIGQVIQSMQNADRTYVCVRIETEHRPYLLLFQIIISRSRIDRTSRRVEWTTETITATH